jgi:hypothetical protein
LRHWNLPRVISVAWFQIRKAGALLFGRRSLETTPSRDTLKMVSTNKKILQDFSSTFSTVGFLTIDRSKNFAVKKFCKRKKLPGKRMHSECEAAEGTAGAAAEGEIPLQGKGLNFPRVFFY